MSNLAEGLRDEMRRCRKLLEVYREIPGGAFGAALIEESIEAAEDAQASGDVVAMLSAYQRLKDHE